METAYDEVYGAQLPHIMIGSRHKPALVVFSAIPGSGKSELTKRLVENHDFSGIANKDIRKALEQAGHSHDVVIGDYTSWLLDKLANETTAAIVFDRNIDQWYEGAKSWAVKNNYKLIVVRIEVSRDRLEKRLHNREGAKVSKVLEVLDYYRDEHRRMGQDIQADLVFEEDYDLDDAAQSIVDTLAK